jgi:hypothetical protein
MRDGIGHDEIRPEEIRSNEVKKRSKFWIEIKDRN